MGRHEILKRFAGLIAVVMLAVGIAAVSAPAASRAGASLPSGVLHATKECSQYNGQAGSFCTITWSNLSAVEVGSKVIYAEAPSAAGLVTDLVLQTESGDRAFGHVKLSFATLSGVVTFAGGTGQLSGFQARIFVTYNPDTNLWHWDGAYRFARH